MRKSATALTGVLILAAMSLSALASSYWWAPSSDIDWDGLAKEVSQLKLSERQMGEFVTYEESLFEKRMRWVSPEPDGFTYVGTRLIPPEKEEDGRSPELCYDFWQRGDVPLTPEIAKALQVEASALPHWTELSRAERLQLFATFSAPEARMPLPAARPPLHLALPVQMGPAGVDEVRELPQLLELAFGDGESAQMLRSE